MYKLRESFEDFVSESILLPKDKFVLKHGEFLITKSYSLIDLLNKINSNNHCEAHM